MIRDMRITLLGHQVSPNKVKHNTHISYSNFNGMARYQNIESQILSNKNVLIVS